LAVVTDFVLGEHEMTLLRQAVRVADRCEDLQAIVEVEGPMISDRFGQPRTHPAVIELRNQQALLAKLCVALRMPIGDHEHEAKSSPLARAQRRGTRGFYAMRGVG
jgi:hypothetical protein